MSILSYEKEEQLLEPVKEHVGKIQAQIDALRADGTTKVTRLQHQLRTLKADRTLSKEEKAEIRKQDEAELAAARKVQAQNKAKIAKLVSEAEAYLDKNYDKQYFTHVEESVVNEKKAAKAQYEAALLELKAEHEHNVKKLNAAGGSELKQELKDENFVYKNRQYDAKTQMKNQIQAAKDRRHAAVSEKFHMIDMLRNSNFTLTQSMAQKWENYRYSFNRRQFLLKNGLYIVIVLIFIALAIIAPIVKNVDLFTTQNVLNILQQASPRMFLALGVAGLILLTGTDLSIGRMVGMGMVIATVVMHKGPNTGSVFGIVFDFSSVPLGIRIVGALIACVIATTAFTMIAGFFTARFKMHPFVSTMANMLIIFGLVTYATKGVSFGAIEADIPKMIVPNVSGFPTIILWAVAATVVVWVIWNKTTFGKNLYAVGGNPEAAAVSGISVFKVTMGAFILAGILYGFGSWLEAARMYGSGSAAYGQGWDMDAIAACVVGGVSFTGGIGKISGVVVGVLIFTGLTYSLTILGIDTNLQFVFEGIIILAAVTLDSLKYVQKK
ncbi:galactoside ABC transporter permease [Arcanobacterium canis]|uniref:Galactoside ABC transporter permease n=1 Tax=Arcanobacterium canis TaxID=999183 RepID=A0ABY8G223_9ACTO|nr:galactoside ABC transporter permease [Arcanobacterium canis]WFM84026.1 galactoside ABC transporter permease [Arcanobacterium canis]